MIEAKRILIVDGNNLVNRCLFSMKELGFWKDKVFTYTGMQYGTINSLIYMNQDMKPDQIVVVWDGGHHRRKSYYPKYKENRKDPKNLDKFKSEDKRKPDHNFSLEIQSTQKLLELMGITQIRIKREEADDVIGTLTKINYQNKFKTIIASNDHDFYQLLRFKNVKVFRNITQGKIIKKELVTKKSFYKKFGIKPKYYPDILALAGDSSDGYAGAKGIGEKTAIKILTQYGPTIEHIPLRYIKEPRILKILNSNIENIKICKKLAKIITNLKINPEDFVTSKPNFKDLKNEFKNLKFHSMLFEDKMSEIKKISKKQYSIVP